MIQYSKILKQIIGTIQLMSGYRMTYGRI